MYLILSILWKFYVLFIVFIYIYLMFTETQKKKKKKSYGIFRDLELNLGTHNVIQTLKRTYGRNYSIRSWKPEQSIHGTGCRFYKIHWAQCSIIGHTFIRYMMSCIRDIFHVACSKEHKPTSINILHINIVMFFSKAEGFVAFLDIRCSKWVLGSWWKKNSCLAKYLLTFRC